jgi:hypothetical protein
MIKISLQNLWNFIVKFGSKAEILLKIGGPKIDFLE